VGAAARGAPYIGGRRVVACAQKEEELSTFEKSLDFTASNATFFMGWLRIVGALKTYVSFAKEPYKRDYVLQKRPVFLRSLLIIATP